jgi:small subunit ribosomal protein S2
VLEAAKLRIPVVAVVDTNCKPDHIDYVVPGNDDAISAINLYTKAAADAVLDARTTLAASGAQDEFVELDASGAPVVGAAEGDDARRGPRKPPQKRKAPRRPEAGAAGEAAE